MLRHAPTLLYGSSIIRTRTVGRRSLLTLAIETSCDDTAVAVLSKSPGGKAALLFNERISSDNRAFRGINPVVAVEGHNAALAPLVERALARLPGREGEEEEEEEEEEEDKPARTVGGRARARLPDFVCATRGPGIMANLSVGLNVAKGLALAWRVPLVGVHHMQAHALTPRLVHALQDGRDTSSSSWPAFPFLSLLVSGGHTQLVLSAGLTDHRILATTGDIAIGNLLDQTARVILPPSALAASPDVMYGRMLEAFAFPPGADTAADYEAFFKPAVSRHQEMQDVPSGYGWSVPLPFRNSRKLAYSLAGIHMHVHNIVAAAASSGSSSKDDVCSTGASPAASPAAASPDDMPLEERRALARHTLRASFQHLASRLILALEDAPSLQSLPVKTLVVAGGVASNRFLMHVLRTTLAARGFPGLEIVAPPVELCTDNAAMVAWAGMEMFEAGYRSELSVRPVAKWPMDPAAGGGMLGIGGWVKAAD
ncbi:sialoglycoprotease gcp [Trichoderma cornu-damae]|uniref:Sialoglycoprotease gcp n=1 Tax=Trichoderma cornu-damae TaxID=654480 RepID=A0A9P8QK46_9HYPO|nr:sialoglycoprotease gcp [Trichoderma cornu-damae]